MFARSRTKRRRHRVGLIVLVLSVMLPLRTLAQEAPPNSYLFVLVDLSASYFTQTMKQRISQSLYKITNGLEQLVEYLPQPVALYVLPIGEASLQNEPLCQILYEATLIPGRHGGDIIRRKEDLKRRLEVCKDFILKQKPRKFTDISGAIIQASSIAPKREKVQKRLIVLSDFVEDRPSKGESPKLNLKGFCVAMAYRVLMEDALKPDSLEQRLEEWVSLFARSGAKKILRYIDTGIDASRLANDLSRC